MELYWVTTPCGYEDWFVLARSKKHAERFHEDGEGFDRNYAESMFVCDIPSELIKKHKIKTTTEDWPSHELLKDLGCKMHSENNPRIVNYKGKIFYEGTFSEAILFNVLVESEGVYVIQIQNTDNYKIGRTKNIRRRIKEFSTGNPYNIKLLYFIRTKHYTSLEKHLHLSFKENRATREWFTFNDLEFKQLEALLGYIQINGTGQFEVFNIKSVSTYGRVI